MNRIQTDENIEPASEFRAMKIMNPRLLVLAVVIVTAASCRPSAPPDDSPPAPPVPRQAASTSTAKQLPALPEGSEEATADLAAGQSLVLRVTATGEPSLYLVRDGDALDVSSATKDVVGLDEDAYAELGCESWYPETSTYEAGEHKLVAVTVVCMSGEDARSFVHLSVIVKASDEPAAKLADLDVRHRGRTHWTENLHSMCITGHKPSLSLVGDRLQMTFTAFAEFQPDPEFDAVQKEDCTKPEAQPPLDLGSVGS